MQNNKPTIYLPNLEDVIDRAPLTVDIDTPLIEVISLMGQLRSTCPLSQNHPLKNPENSLLLGEARASCVLVVEPSQTSDYPILKGIFTERDLVALIAKANTTLKNHRIGDLMTQPVITISETEAQDVFTVLLLLRQYHIRHLPITNKNGQLIGVVTPETIRQAMLQPANLLKMRRVDEVMNTQVIQAPTTASVLQVARLMAENRVSCVIICQPQNPTADSSNSPPQYPVGMVTERDIVQFQALELDLEKVQAQTVMSTPLFCLQPENSLWVAHQEMQQRYVRRLVVADENNTLLGVVTQTSLLRVLDPIEMSGIIDGLQIAVEQRTSELQKTLAELSQVVAKLESEITTRKHTEEWLRLLESVVLNANDAIVIMDSSGSEQSDPKILFINQAFTQLTGYKPEEIIGQTPSLLRGPNSDPTQVAKIRQAFSNHQPVRVEIVNYRKNGTPYWVELNSVPVTDEKGKLTHWISVQRDITERKRMEQALYEEKELAQVTLQSIGDGVITTDADGRISSLNPIAQKLTGWSTAEAQGLPLHKIFRVINEITGAPVENILESALQKKQITDLVNHNVLIARTGYQFAIDYSASPIHSYCGQLIGAVLVFRDVTQIRTQARQLSWQATHDALTGLVNRREFEYQLEQALFSAERNNQEHILLYLDLDRFKIVNDTCGHVAGDELLRQVTAEFKNTIRQTDILARLGGDEFAVLLYQCPQSRGIQVAESILHSIQSFRFVWQDKTFSIGVSIGLVTINSTSQSASAVLCAADGACYSAKDKGRNRVHIYEPNDSDLAKQRGQTQWVLRLSRALEENQFCLYYQPIVAIANPNLNENHCEILLRLRDENGQLISPMAFIPSAERYHLMHTIDRWVIRNLFEQLSSFIKLEKSQLYKNKIPDKKPNVYAINLSGDSLNDDQFIQFLEEQFASHSIPPQIICFEITETVAIANLSKAATLIKTLREMGCRFALDDFGSGMSSFAYLRNLPVDFLKIDGNFVKNIAENPIDLAMVEAINRIGHVMGIKTIAEFVENEATIKKLKELGVDYAQGYGIVKPQPFQIKPFLANQGMQQDFFLNTLTREKLAC